VVTNHQRIGAISNANTGRDFEIAARVFYQIDIGVRLLTPFLVPIGAGATTKAHRFDLGAEHPPILIECKSHRWTETGNLPSAKLSVLNEAMYYFYLAPQHYRKVLVMVRSHHPRRVETLAEYYVRSHAHMIPAFVEVVEYDEEQGVARCIKPAVL
jgi:hypothetical protein